jgi:hypothetical protein
MDPDHEEYPFPSPADTHADWHWSSDIDREGQRQVYKLCRLGFGILSFSLLLAIVSCVVVFAAIFGGPWLVSWYYYGGAISPRNVTGALVTWGSLVGVYLLWGRWRAPAWQRRAGLLLLMSLVDVALWCVEHAPAISIPAPQEHEWLLHHLGEALGWAEFVLIASLACDFLQHLGVEHAPAAGKATCSLAATGAVIWGILFVQSTQWGTWPLIGRLTPDKLLLLMGSHTIWTLTLIQVTALTFSAAQQASRVLTEMNRDEQELDPLGTSFAADMDRLARDDDRRR